MSTELDLLTKRVELLEEVVNSLQVALTNVAPSEAISQILLLSQRDTLNLQDQIDQLTTEVALLRGEVIT